MATSTWSESTVTWSNAPTSSATELVAITAEAGSNGSLIFDLTPVVANGINTLVLTTAASHYFLSKESGTGTGPGLTVIY